MRFNHQSVLISMTLRVGHELLEMILDGAWIQH